MAMRPFPIVLSLIVLCGIGIPCEARAESLRVGTAMVDITPPEAMLPIAVNGGFNARFLDTITDRLHAKAIALSEGDTTIILCTIDSCVIDRALMDEAKAKASKNTGVPTEQMLVSATHAHSCPASVGVHGTDADQDYRALLIEKLAESLTKATENMVPAEFGYGVGQCTEWVHCRRWLMQPGTALTVPFTGHSQNRAQMNPGHSNANKIQPTGPRDTAVTVMALRTRDGQPLAIYANYSTHYAGAPGISADYFGVFGREMKRLTGGGEDFVGIMSNGTSGDANCINYHLDVPRKFTHVMVGKDVAQIAYDVYKKIHFKSDVEIDSTQALLTLDVRVPTENEVALAKKYLKENVGDKLPKGMTQVYARETVILSEMPPTRELKLQAYRIGDLGIGTIPCETYAITGLALKLHSPFKTTLIVGLANGWNGYLPTPIQHALGGYTTWRARASLLEVEAEPRIREVVAGLLKKVDGGGDSEDDSDEN